MDRAILRTCEAPHRDPRGRFVVGNSGRPRGPNRINRCLREAILVAAEELGSNGRGAGGLLGFLKMVARKDLRAFVGLMARCVPVDLHTKAEEPVTYRSTEEVYAELERRGIGSGMMEILAERMAEREQRGKSNGGNGTLNGGGTLN